MPTIALLDPSMPGENENESDNLGDVIIAESISSILAEMFPAHEIIRFPTKRAMSQGEKSAIRSCALIFLGGTNILNGDLKAYNQWKIDTSILSVLRPQFDGVIAMGVGWWQYQERTTLRTKLFYKHVLHRKAYHAVRDQYSYSRLVEAGISNALNTSCPTAWGLDGRGTRREIGLSSDIVFTLTDYMRSEIHDNRLIRALLEHSTGKLLFFPQGSRDIEYIESLSEFKNNKKCITLMPRQLGEFNNIALDSRALYVGTRLHGGIKFLQCGREALIVCVDNRATEIHKDIGLPAVAREDFGGLSAWIQGKLDFGNISLPLNQIRQWKSQFTTYQ
jgi:polysaccharide pyruvyl transferase WcaK-like protein